MDPLDLAHSWAPSDTTGTAARGKTSATALEARENSGCSESNKPEPQECSDGLCLMAALASVVRAVGDGVGSGI